MPKGMGYPRKGKMSSSKRPKKGSLSKSKPKSNKPAKT